MTDEVVLGVINRVREQNKQYREDVNFLCDVLEALLEHPKPEKKPDPTSDEDFEKALDDVVDRMERSKLTAKKEITEDTCAHKWVELHYSFGDPSRPTGRRCSNCRKQEFY